MSKHSVTITVQEPDKAPAGYGFSGEYRTPKAGEYWFSATGVAHAVRAGSDYDDADGRFWILVKQPEVAPEGYEFTGEYRCPLTDDCFEENGRARTIPNYMYYRDIPSNRRWILRRKAEPKPHFDIPFVVQPVIPNVNPWCQANCPYALRFPNPPYCFDPAQPPKRRVTEFWEVCVPTPWTEPDGSMAYYGKDSKGRVFAWTLPSNAPSDEIWLERKDVLR